MRKTKGRAARLVISLVMTMVIGLPGGAAAETVTVEAAAEPEAAYVFLQNLQMGIPARRVRIPATLDINKIFGYVDAVCSSKIRFSGLQIQHGTQSVCDYYMELRDPDEAMADIRAQELAESLVQPDMTNAEKIRTFHDYLVEMCEPDLEAEAAVERGEADAVDRYIASFSASGALLYGKAVCDGYAGAMVKLCQYAAVPCFRISSVSMNHAWNYVFDGESWSYVDVIFDDSSASDQYLMISAEELAKTHRFDDGTQGTVSLGEYNDFLDYYSKRMTEDGEKDQAVNRAEIAARMLNRLGMLRGTEDGFELDRVPTRNEMAAMLVRILGKESDARQGNYASPFLDAGWAKDYVGYLYQNRLVAGIGETEFGGELGASRNDYATLLLRTLQYSDAAGDFQWDTAAQTCMEMGIKGGEPPAPFTRGDMAQMTLHALMAKRKTDGIQLLDYLAASMAGARPLVQDVIAEYRQLACWN